METDNELNETYEDLPDLLINPELPLHEAYRQLCNILGEESYENNPQLFWWLDIVLDALRKSPAGGDHNRQDGIIRWLQNMRHSLSGQQLPWLDFLEAFSENLLNEWQPEKTNEERGGLTIEDHKFLSDFAYDLLATPFQYKVVLYGMTQVPEPQQCRFPYKLRTPRLPKPIPNEPPREPKKVTGSDVMLKLDPSLSSVANKAKRAKEISRLIAEEEERRKREAEEERIRSIKEEKEFLLPLILGVSETFIDQYFPPPPLPTRRLSKKGERQETKSKASEVSSQTGSKSSSSKKSKR